MRPRVRGEAGQRRIPAYAGHIDFGIIIRMFYQEHRPPHFHAEYQGQQATFDFEGELMVGAMHSGVARRLIRESAIQRRPELEANWTRMEAGLALDRIEPLE